VATVKQFAHRHVHGWFWRAWQRGRNWTRLRWQTRWSYVPPVAYWRDLKPWPVLAWAALVVVGLAWLVYRTGRQP
jgi:hypothetical protein